MKSTYDSTSTFEDLAASFKVLSHPARLYILNLILKHGDLNCGEIVDKTPRSQSTVSQHLQELYKHGFLKIETNGPERRYSIHNKKIRRVVKKMEGFIEKLDHQELG